MTAQRHNRALVWFFVVFVATFAAALLWKPSFGIIDDSRLLDTILIGKRLPWFVEPQIGRFAPLQGQEYNVIGAFSTSPVAFFLCNAVEFLIAAWLMVRIGQLGSKSKQSNVSYLVALCLFVLPGFTESWFRLFVPERSEFLCIGALLYGYLRYRKTPRFRFFALGLGCAVLALFCKETAFVLVGGIGFFGLLLQGSSARRLALRRLDMWLVLFSGAWLLVYYFVCYRFRGRYLYGARPDSSLHASLHTLAATLLHDPLLILLLGLGALLLLRRRVHVDPLLPVLLCTIAALITAYIALHMSNNYYLLPAYALVPFVAGSLLTEPLWLTVVRTPLLVALFTVCAINQAMVGLQEVTRWRTDPQQFQNLLPVLVAAVQHSPQPRQVIFLAGVDAGNSIEFYTALGGYLLADGVAREKFDLRNAQPVADPVTWMRIVPMLPNLAFSFEQSMTPQQEQPHDLLLVMPASSVQARQQLQNATEYRLLYRTDALVYPNLTLKRIARLILLRGRPGVDDRINPNYALYEKLR